MGKALTKEDLIYILQAVLKLSQLPTNALHRDADNGLYVEDYHQDLQAHTEDSSVHVTQQILDVLSRIAINESDELTYDGKQLMTYISQKPNNGLSQKDDGLYVPALQISKEADNVIGIKDDGLYVKNTDASKHVGDDSIHVTQEDKDEWNAMLYNANDYTDEEISRLPIHDFCFTTSLPATGQESMIYFLANNPDSPKECTYSIHIWRDNKWHTLTATNNTFNLYVTQEQFIESLKGFVHSNQNVLDALTEDENGRLCFKGQSVFDTLLIHPSKKNAIQIKDGQLYVYDYTEEITSMAKASFLTKTNLYNEEISQSGKYQLKDDIMNYNLLLIEYYYKPDNDRDSPGCAKTAIVDVDTLIECRQLGRNYMLEYGYGVMTSNSQIYIEGDMLTVNYYHNVCIYKITGIRKGDDDG